MKIFTTTQKTEFHSLYDTIRIENPVVDNIKNLQPRLIISHAKCIPNIEFVHFYTNNMPYSIISKKPTIQDTLNDQTAISSLIHHCQKQKKKEKMEPAAVKPVIF